jgi:hypothetical protein
MSAARPKTHTFMTTPVLVLFTGTDITKKTIKKTTKYIARCLLQVSAFFFKITEGCIASHFNTELKVGEVTEQ